jgi:hypothetical protein
MPPASLLIVLYDVSDDATWEAAKRHVRWWGRLYVDAHDVGIERVVVVFRPATDRRWAEWERVRAGWIMRDLAARVPLEEAA